MRILVCIFVFFLGGNAIADHHESNETKAAIGALAWMTGSWEGALGPNTLEENWSEAKAGTIASLVRMTGPTGTSMVEIVHIEETEGSLVLHIQQWDPGYKSRGAAQKMTLKAVGERSVDFVAASAGGLAALGYRRPTDTTFEIIVTTADDQRMVIKMDKVNR